MSSSWKNTQRNLAQRFSVDSTSSTIYIAEQHSLRALSTVNKCCLDVQDQCRVADFEIAVAEFFVDGSSNVRGDTLVQGFAVEREPLHDRKHSLQFSLEARAASDK